MVSDRVFCKVKFKILGTFLHSGQTRKKGYSRSWKDQVVPAQETGRVYQMETFFMSIQVKRYKYMLFSPAQLSILAMVVCKIGVLYSTVVYIISGYDSFHTFRDSGSHPLSPKIKLVHYAFVSL